MLKYYTPKFTCNQCGVADTRPAFRFSAHFAKQGGCYWILHSSYPFGKFRQSDNQLKHVYRVFNVTEMPEIKGNCVWWTERRSDPPLL